MLTNNVSVSNKDVSQIPIYILRVILAGGLLRAF